MSRRTLIACLGNIFLGDDGSGMQPDVMLSMAGIGVIACASAYLVR